MRMRPLVLLLSLTALLPSVSAHATVRIVNQSGLTFVPADITISAGDTVNWVWSAGIHTVTNGTSLADPQLGLLFDAPLTTANRTFQFRFTTPGVVPYLCTLHAAFGMTGTVTVQAPSGSGDGPAAALLLRQNTPNPFNPSTQIEFAIAGTGADVPATLRVYDARGRLVRTLVDGPLAPGPHGAVWDGRDDAGRVVGSGVYAYRLVAGGRTQMKSMTLLK